MVHLLHRLYGADAPDRDIDLRAILTGRVWASLYCSFTPLSPTGVML